MSQNTFDDKSTLIEAMAGCRQTRNISRANIDPIQCRHMAPLNHNGWKPQGPTNNTIQRMIIGKTTYRPMVHTAYVIIASYHYNDVKMTTMASQITSLTVVYPIVYSGADHRKHQSCASLAFVRGIHRDRWILRTKGQLRGKCFHLMTSSCTKEEFNGLCHSKNADIFLILTISISAWPWFIQRIDCRYTSMRCTKLGRLRLRFIALTLCSLRDMVVILKV